MFFELSRKFLRGTRFQSWAITDFVYAAYVARLQSKLPGDDLTVTVPFRGHDFRIERGDITILPTLLRGEYEKDELDAVLSSLALGSTIVDVGANIGIYSVLALDVVGPQGHVICIEPNPDAVALLQSNLRSSNAVQGSYTVLECALSNIEGNAAWQRTKYQGTGHLAVDGASIQTGSQVVLRTLDSLLVELDRSLKDGLIKIDVEGFEPLVVLGARRTIERDKPSLLLELSGSQSAQVGVDWAEALAFLSRVYARTVVFGPCRAMNESSSVGETLRAVLEDGRLHNVLLAGSPQAVDRPVLH